MTIYLDAVITLNVLFDMMLLLLTNYIVKANASRLRIFLAALFAALIVPIHIYFPQSFLTTALGKVLFSMLIILIAFRLITVFHFLKLLMTFYFVTFAIGGGLIATYYLFEHPLISIFNQYAIRSQYGDPLSWLFVLIGFPLIAFYLKRQLDRQQIQQLEHNQLYPVVIRMNMQSYQTNGFLDTGNQLIDPLTKQPVVICDAIFLQQWFEKSDWDALTIAYHRKDYSAIPEQWSNQIRLIPYYGVSGKRELLMALRPESLIVFINEEKIVNKNVLVGIQFGKLSIDETYHCLLHPHLITSQAKVS